MASSLICLLNNMHFRDSYQGLFGNSLSRNSFSKSDSKILIDLWNKILDSPCLNSTLFSRFRCISTLKYSPPGGPKIHPSTYFSNQSSHQLFKMQFKSLFSTIVLALFVSHGAARLIDATCAEICAVVSYPLNHLLP